MTNRSLTLRALGWSIACAVLAASCSNPTETTADSGAVADKGAPHDSGTQRDAKGGWPDMYPIPYVGVSVITPYHLMTALPVDFKSADRPISVGLYPYKVDPATAKTQLQSAFTVMTRETKQPVQGVWTFDWQGNRFVPSTLTKDTEYLIEIKKQGYLLPSREYTAFRVGSLPRVVAVSFQESATSANDVDLLVLTFSERLDVTKVGAALTLKTTGASAKFLATTVTTPTSMSPTWQIGFQLPAGVSISTKLSITLGTDVGSPTGVALDGKYTGVAGSGPFALELVPQDYLGSKNGKWEPNLSF